MRRRPYGRSRPIRRRKDRPDGPDRTLRIFRDPTNDRDERLDAARDLYDWLQRGGHAPDGEDRRDLFAEVRQFLDDAPDAHLEAAYDERYELEEGDR